MAPLTMRMAVGIQSQSTSQRRHRRHCGENDCNSVSHNRRRAINLRMFCMRQAAVLLHLVALSHVRNILLLSLMHVFYKFVAPERHFHHQLSIIY